MGRILYSKLSLIVYFLIATIVVLNINKDMTVSSKKQENLNFILIGKDGYDDERIDRGDALMLVNVRFEEQVINLISIPRDSLVTIPCGATGNVVNKIAHAYSYGEANWKNKGGGGVCVSSTVERLFGLPPTFFILVSFDAVKEGIDQIGGIDVTPKFSFQVGDEHFTKGKLTHLDGQKALMYVRHRKSLPFGDIDRTYQQRQVVTAAFKKLRNLSTTERIKLAFFGLTKVATNAPIQKLSELANINYNSFSITSQVLQGSDYYIEGGYYYKVNKSHVQKIAKIIQ